MAEIERSPFYDEVRDRAGKGRRGGPQEFRAPGVPSSVVSRARERAKRVIVKRYWDEAYEAFRQEVRALTAIGAAGMNPWEIENAFKAYYEGLGEQEPLDGLGGPYAIGWGRTWEDTDHGAFHDLSNAEAWPYGYAGYVRDHLEAYSDWPELVLQGPPRTPDAWGFIEVMTLVQQADPNTYEQRKDLSDKVIARMTVDRAQGSATPFTLDEALRTGTGLTGDRWIRLLHRYMDGPQMRPGQQDQWMNVTRRVHDRAVGEGLASWEDVIYGVGIDGGAVEALQAIVPFTRGN